MTNETRSLSAAEINAVAGGRQDRDRSQSLVVMPDPGFVIDTPAPGPGPSSHSREVTQAAGDS
jgi:hypothetical protein